MSVALFFLVADPETSQQSMSLADDMLQTRSRDDPLCPPSFLDDYATLPDVLRNRGISPYVFPTDIDQDARFAPSEEQIRTMNAVSRSLVCVDKESPLQLIGKCDGPTLAFMAKCTGVCMPEHIKQVLYLFQQLSEHAKGAMNGYIIPTTHTDLTYSRDDPVHRVVTGVREAMTERDVRARDQEPSSTGGTGWRNWPAQMRKRACPLDGAMYIERQLVTMMVGFTGATIQTDLGGEERALLCVAYIRPVRGFDIFSFMLQCLLAPPRKSATKQQADHVAELELLWRGILQYEANINHGLMEDPCEYFGDPYGSAYGAGTLTALLTLPGRIHHVLLMHFPEATRIEVCGMPLLTFRREDRATSSYDAYVTAALDDLALNYDELRGNIQEYYNIRKIPDRMEKRYRVRCPGGWPHRDGNGQFVYFTLFPLLVLMRCLFMRRSCFGESRDSFVINLPLPELAVKKLRDFLSGVGAMVIPDEEILRDDTQYTPVERTKKYKEADYLLQEVLNFGSMAPWREAFFKLMHARRAVPLEEGGASPEEGWVLLEGHLRSCMLHYLGMVESGEFRSVPLKACYDRLLKLDKAVPRGGLRDHMQGMRERLVVPQLRVDDFASTVRCFYLTMSELNRYLALNALNLELLLAVLVSSVMYYFTPSRDRESDLPSIKFMVQMVGGLTHFKYKDPKTGEVYDDSRKQYTTGANTVQNRYNTLQTWMCGLAGVSSDAFSLLEQTRATMCAVENQGCVTFTRGQITGAPEPGQLYAPRCKLESRPSEQEQKDSLTKELPRDTEWQGMTSHTTGEQIPGTNQREQITKYRVYLPNILVMASNCLPKNAEQQRAQNAVVRTMSPGAPPYNARTFDDKENRQPNDVQHGMNDMRPTAPSAEQKTLFCKLLLGSLDLTKAIVAGVFRSGALSLQINDQTKHFLDWMFLNIKNHLFCITNPSCNDSYGRQKVTQFCVLISLHALMIMCATSSKGMKVGRSPGACACTLCKPLRGARTSRSLFTRAVWQASWTPCRCRRSPRYATSCSPRCCPVHCFRSARVSSRICRCRWWTWSICVPFSLRDRCGIYASAGGRDCTWHVERALGRHDGE